MRRLLMAALTLGLPGSAFGQSSLPPLDLDLNDPASEETEVRGVVQPKDEAVIAADITVTVLEMPFREGQSFHKGDLLVAFDCRRFNADIEAAKANLAAATATLRSNQELASYNAVGSLELRQSQAAVASASAEVRALEARAVNCEIRAPFNGRVVETMINAFETPAENQPLMQILDDSQLELHVVVPSRWLVWLREGDEFEFLVDETGTSHLATVQRLGASVDPVSQTIKVIGTFADRPERVLAGMSGVAAFREKAN
ncbi:MAG: efflux RND transporter periplasmic adaptor subunit [Pseudomonadota bacterium]